MYESGPHIRQFSYNRSGDVTANGAPGGSTFKRLAMYETQARRRCSRETACRVRRFGLSQAPLRPYR